MQNPEGLHVIVLTSDNSRAPRHAQLYVTRSNNQDFASTAGPADEDARSWEKTDHATLAASGTAATVGFPRRDNYSSSNGNIGSSCACVCGWREQNNAQNFATPVY